MRLKIYLEPYRNEYSIPINYQYLLSSVVYKIFQNGSQSIAKWLHDNGFKDEKGRSLKLFNFSGLVFEKHKVREDIIHCSGVASFIFSSPVKTNLIKTFVSGILLNPNFEIVSRNLSVKFYISNIEILPEPIFEETNYYKSITPINVSTQRIENGKRKIEYLNPSDKRYVTQIKNNLLKKFNLIYSDNLDSNIEITINSTQNIKSKLITIKEGTMEETKVKGYLHELEIKAPYEIHKIAYYCGIGEKNSLGFGMIELK
ncbi:MAG: CRISPR-associated endoribonuclease Cas6 [Candidatus Kapaibacteriota bacterium]